MTKHSIAELAFKLLGIYLLVDLVASLDYVIPLLLRDEFGDGPINFVGPGLEAAAAVLLLVNADWLARKLVGPDDAGVGAATVDVQNMQEVAFSVAGVLIIVRAVGALFSSITFTTQISGPEGIGVVGNMPMPWIGLVGPILQLIIGIVLFSGARRISQWVSGARARDRNYDVGDAE